MKKVERKRNLPKLRIEEEKIRLVLSCIFLLGAPFFLTGCVLKQAYQPSAIDSSLQSDNNDTSVNTENSRQTAGPSAVPNTSSYLAVEPSILDPDIRANSKLADTKSKVWKKDAKLIHFSAKFPPGLPIGQVTETFTFGSASDAYNWWTMTISGKTGKSVRALIPKEDYLGSSLEPVPSRFWKTNYLEAFQQAELNGGKEFRETHPDSEVTVSLALGEPNNYLWWTIDYNVDDTTRLKLLVNPASKEVFTVDGLPISNSASISPNSTMNPI